VTEKDGHPFLPGFPNFVVNIPSLVEEMLLCAKVEILENRVPLNYRQKTTFWAIDNSVQVIVQLVVSGIEINKHLLKQAGFIKMLAVNKIRKACDRTDASQKKFWMYQKKFWI